MRSNKTCKNPALWHFTALRKSWATSGDYCWSHLWSRGIFGDMDEDQRYRDHMYEIGHYCQSISPAGRRCWRLASRSHVEHYTAPWTEPYSSEPNRVQHDETWYDSTTSHLKLA